MFRLRSCASSMISVSYCDRRRVALRLGEQDAVGHQLDVAVAGRAVGEADLVADQAAELGLQFLRDARRWRGRCAAAAWPIRPATPRPVRGRSSAAAWSCRNRSRRRRSPPDVPGGQLGDLSRRVLTGRSSS